MDSEVQRKAKVVEAMHSIMCNANDEYAYDEWIWVVPDGADYDDFVSIAEDDDTYVEVCELFARLVNKYGKGGI